MYLGSNDFKIDLRTYCKVLYTSWHKFPGKPTDPVATKERRTIGTKGQAETEILGWGYPSYLTSCSNIEQQNTLNRMITHCSSAQRSSGRPWMTQLRQSAGTVTSRWRFSVFPSGETVFFAQVAPIPMSFGFPFNMFGFIRTWYTCSWCW